MILVIIIQIILIALALLAINKRVYSDSNFIEKVKTPIWFYLLGGVLSIIPILGLIALFVLLMFYLIEVISFPDSRKRYYYTSYFYKPGKFLTFIHNIGNFLNKKI